MMNLEWMVNLGYIFLLLALASAMYRLIKGPGLLDRVVALDLVAMVIAGFITVYAIESKLKVFLDVVMVLAMVVFFGTVAFGRYLEKKMNGGNELD